MLHHQTLTPHFTIGRNLTEGAASLLLMMLTEIRARLGATFSDLGPLRLLERKRGLHQSKCQPQSKPPPFLAPLVNFTTPRSLTLSLAAGERRRQSASGAERCSSLCLARQSQCERYLVGERISHTVTAAPSVIDLTAIRRARVKFIVALNAQAQPTICAGREKRSNLCPQLNRMTTIGISHGQDEAFLPRLSGIIDHGGSRGG
ncbi:hypothetical protein B0T14DRAFT_62169 [Immersiella caudata]|uniref:Uncharacterized protein n=1 Tax=Immersiella caudata TaxID=314043 RepID=A0AA39XG12_9PEZI|nr:hypothetical protein B0T14DRAFT_62169 [Immersiella caudata]